MAGSLSLIIYSIKQRYPSSRPPKQEMPHQSLQLILRASSAAPLPPHPRSRCRASLLSRTPVSGLRSAPSTCSPVEPVGSVTVLHIDTLHAATPVTFTSVLVTNSMTRGLVSSGVSADLDGMVF